MGSWLEFLSLWVTWPLQRVPYTSYENTHHGKFEKQLHVHRKKKSNHVSRKNTNHIHVVQAFIQKQSLQMYLNILVVFHVLNVCISWLCAE